MKKHLRNKDFKESFENFLAEYKMDRIADVHDYLENDAEYKTLYHGKLEKEKALLDAITDKNTNNMLMDYIKAVDFMLDEFETIFYEHGFHDCITINLEMHKGLNRHFPAKTN